MEITMMENLLTEAFASVNIIIVLGLMGVGFIIKHVDFLKNVENSIIPPVLLVLGLVAAFIENGFTFPAAITGIVSAAVAVGLHQHGQNIFSVTIIPKIKEWLTSIFNKNTDGAITDEEIDNAIIEEGIDEELSIDEQINIE